MRAFCFSVPGEPVPLARPRTTAGMRGVYDDPKSAKAKRRFAAIARTYAPPKPLAEPLKVALVFSFERPKSHFGTGKNASKLKASAPEHYTKKPDIDNLEKLVFDALNGLFYVDDAQICVVTKQKFYGDKAQTMVLIETIEEAEF